MGRVIQFEERAVATLRERLGEAESARADLAAFARGHSGAVATIHSAVMAALEADDFDALVAVVTRDWPAMRSHMEAHLDGLVRNLEAHFAGEDG